MKSAWEIVGYGLRDGDALLSFRSQFGEYLGRVDGQGRFVGDVIVEHFIQFPDGSHMMSAGVPDAIDLGEF